MRLSDWLMCAEKPITTIPIPKLQMMDNLEGVVRYRGYGFEA